MSTRYFLLLIIAFISGILVKNITKFEFEYEINIFELISLLFTIIIAYLITNFFEPRNASKRAQIEFIIDHLKLVENESKDLFHLISKVRNKNIGNAEKYEITSSFKRLSINISNVIDIIDFCKKYEKIVDKNKFQTLFFKFKKTTTGGKFGSVNFIINQSNYSEIFTAYKGLNAYLMEVIIKINNFA